MNVGALLHDLFNCDEDRGVARGSHVAGGGNHRRAYRLGYPSQRESPRDRSITRAFKLRGRLSGEGGIGDYIPKPKWMRWQTYECEIARIEAAEKSITATCGRLCNSFKRNACDAALLLRKAAMGG